MPTTKKKTTVTKKSKVKPVEKLEEQHTPVTPGGKFFYAHGKRKTSIAKVRLYKGKGVITINDKPANEYCSLKINVGIIKSPLKITGTLDKYDITVTVTGGGIRSQADAIRHGISRALLEAEPLLKPTLRKAGLLTRDSRIKERKKYGMKRARKGPQFAKR